MKRREFLAVAAVAGLPAAVMAQEKTASGKKVWPKVPQEWYGQGMYEELAAKGRGVPAPGPKDRPVAYIAFDPQCQWCERLHRAAAPLYGKVRVVWVPVAVLNVNSEPQGSMILSAPDPWSKFLENEERFHDKDFRGIPVDQKLVWQLPAEIRQRVWDNSKIVRRNGCRTVPFGVFKTSAGEYRPIYSGMTTEDLEKAFGL